LRRTLLGCEVDFLKSEAILDALRVRHAEGRPTLIGYHNLHTLYMATQEARLAGFYQRADIIYADGMPLIMWARLLGLPVTRDHRMTLSSWAPEVLRSFQGNGWRLFYLGASAEACAKGVAAFRSLAPGLEIEARDGFFNAEPGHPDNQTLMARISGFKPDVLMIGMGTPRQELWIQDNLDRLRKIPIIWSVGAAIEYFAGTKARPPAVIGRLGLEWLYRLISEPARLWRRYLVEPVFLLPAMLRDLRHRGGHRPRG
jgi:N-acetylglucosaminyldiphosphoundecaprenol N-acetyl-beta-D-mannosaminyltransferase